MNKICKTLLICLMAFIASICFVACGDTGNGGDNKPNYKVFGDDAYYTLVSYDGNEESVTIPAEYNGKPVGRIKKDAFSGNSTIKTLVIPNSVEVIDKGAFAKMKGLENLTIPFVGNTKNAEATLNDNNVTGTDKSVNEARTFGYLFSSADYDGSIKVTQYFNDSTTTDNEGNVTPTGTFDCYLPENLKVVTVSPKDNGYLLPAYAFANNRLITKVVLTEKVKEIGEFAFADCQRLNEIAIPSSVTDIHKYAFRGTRSLGDYNAETGKGLSFKENSSLVSIGDSAFAGAKFTSITLPDSVEKIGKFAFASIQTELTVSATGASQLMEITLSKNLKEIGDYAFFMCEKLEKVNLHQDSQNLKIGVQAFAYCDSLSSFASNLANTIDLTKVSTLKATAFAFIEKDVQLKVISTLSSSVLDIAFVETNYSL